MSETSAGEKPSRVRVGIAVGILVLLGALALRSAYFEWRDERTPVQLVAMLCELVYGACGVLAALALAMRSRWARPLLMTWAVFVTITAGLAPVVWGGAPAFAGVLSALAGSVIAVAVVFLACPPRWKPN